jgi:DNA-binding NtrC family response regulator
MPRRRNPDSELARLLDEAPTPIYVLDDHRRIVYVNAACAAWTGVAAAELVGRRCNYHSPDAGEEPSALAAALCPPPEAFAGKRLAAFIAPLGSRNGSDRRRAEFLPLRSGGDQIIGVVVAVQPAEAADMPDRDASSAEPSATELHEMVRAFCQDARRKHRLERLIGDSPAMRRVREQVALAIQGQSRVLIVGPPGSGREHVARTIHYGAPREAIAPLVPQDSSILDAELLQSTITSFVRRCSELAMPVPGTLLLLDADKLPSDAQTELAGFLNIREFDLHIVATSRVPLLELASRGEYRRDLAFALSTLVIELPPLAGRREDIPLLAQLFLEEFNAAGGRQLGGFSPEAMDRLFAYPWPNNVDELVRMVEQAAQAAEGPLVSAGDLPKRIYDAADAAAHPRRADDPIKLDAFLEDVERQLIRRALARAKGNKSKAAELLGVSRPRLLRRISQLGLDAQAPGGEAAEDGRHRQGY